MIIEFEVNEYRNVSPKLSSIGNKNEKNVNDLHFNIKNNDNLNFYLLFDDKIMALDNGSIAVDSRMTEKEGFHECFILGSDAKPGKKLSEGKHFFKSDNFYLKVG